MKVIDLLNKIANGEEVSTFRYLDRTLRYNKEEKCFDDINDICYCRTGFGCNGLNDEVEIIEEEIIEEDKKIEKIDLSEWAEITYSEDWKMLTYDFNRNCNLFVNKINEIIDYLEEK